jgi:hypothetical protein
MTEASRLALENLRDPSLFKWYVIPLLLLVLYVYSNEIERRNWSMVFAGLALWGMDWFNEIINGLILHFSGFSALWTAPADSAFIILVGLNIEICFMFAIMGIVTVKWLPKDKTAKIWGIPNRLFFALINSLLCVFIEVLLNAADALIWEYWFWNVPFLFPIVILGYLTFFVVAFWVYDMEKTSSQIKTLGVIYSVDAVGLILFAGILGWI